MTTAVGAETSESFSMARLALISCTMPTVMLAKMITKKRALLKDPTASTAITTTSAIRLKIVQMLETKMLL